MTQEDYFKRFETVISTMLATTKRKNKDYAGPNDAFKNFKMIDILTNKKISVEQGILVRMTDKLARLGTLLTQEKESRAVSDESIADTLLDMAVYAVIMIIYVDSDKQDAVPERDMYVEHKSNRI